MTEDREEIERRLADKLDAVIQECMAEYAKLDDTERFMPTHWVLIVGAMTIGSESACTYVPRNDQPLYVSHGLIQYQRDRLAGIIQRDEDD